MNEGLFELLADTLEAQTSLSRLEARGTVRLALREAGLEPGKLTQRYAVAVAEKALPGALQARGIENAGDVCSAIVRAIRASEDGAEDSHRPETLFERLQAD